MIFEKLFKSLFKIDDYLTRSGSWSRVRKEHLENNPNCAACGKNKNIQVHHIKPFHSNPELELAPENLISLCDYPCHLVFGHLMNYQSWNENVVKDCKIYYEKIKNRP